MIRARQKLEFILPRCEDCLDKAALVKLQGPKVERILDGEALTSIRIFHCSCSKLEFSLKNPWKPTLNGGHLNCNRIFQSHSDLKFNILAQRNGCAFAEFQIAQGDKFYKTLYPNHWDPTIIDQKIREALRNIKSLESVIEKKTIIAKNVEILKSSDTKRWIGVGKTSEGLEIKIALEYKNGSVDIVSAYPCKDWIIKGGEHAE
jgi:hypothetical protein